ncbi:unnamed protein product [Microthlaspi erraticum]|uniref:Uncharacterized protein n=1 Tax=Microthlaspi erraticum TaxID=1685480 RepID=A0A6D2I4U6_9BRAS|nr:unnamed protein product [Microthlaspi erraticum]
MKVTFTHYPRQSGRIQHLQALQLYVWLHPSVPHQNLGDYLNREYFPSAASFPISLPVKLEQQVAETSPWAWRCKVVVAGRFSASLNNRYGFDRDLIKLYDRLRASVRVYKKNKEIDGPEAATSWY